MQIPPTPLPTVLRAAARAARDVAHGVHTMHAVMHGATYSTAPTPRWAPRRRGRPDRAPRATGAEEAGTTG